VQETCPHIFIYIQKKTTYTDTSQTKHQTLFLSNLEKKIFALYM